MTATPGDTPRPRSPHSALLDAARIIDDERKTLPARYTPGMERAITVLHRLAAGHLQAQLAEALYDLPVTTPAAEAVADTLMERTRADLAGMSAAELKELLAAMIRRIPAGLSVGNLLFRRPAAPPDDQPGEER